MQIFIKNEVNFLFQRASSAGCMGQRWGTLGHLYVLMKLIENGDVLKYFL